MSKLTLISFALCPFVQRAIIALKEKGTPFDVIYVDLANKPDWFLALSPLGKVPVLKVERTGKPDGVVFESAVIMEYLEETAVGVALHPVDPLERAQHRAWIEFASATFGDMWKLTTAKTPADLDAAAAGLNAKLKRVEDALVGPFFAGESFSLVDTAFAPAFRQLDTLEEVTGSAIVAGLPKVAAWRKALAARPSVQGAVPADYVKLYLDWLKGQDAAVLKLAA
jgi:glutathione S-transferase